MNEYQKSLDRIKKGVFPSDDWTEEDREHLRIVENALEKQIPKKPIKTEMPFAMVNRCPNCKSLIWCKKYCDSCGQAIDWGCDE